jgi:hypothetical protein
MAANPSIANLRVIPNVLQIGTETSELKPTSLLQRIEVVLRKAFGEDEETIANSLRGL